MKKEKYLELMERTLAAYDGGRISSYFEEVKRDGLTEHGFPRLTANIGILISHGRRGDLLEIFLEMMEFCCKSIPNHLAANDFSVREIIIALCEVENSGIADVETVERWKNYLRLIDCYKTYDKFATSTDDEVRNWALFTGLSEFFRQKIGLCDNDDFIEMQLLQQLKYFDENGMYMDNSQHTDYQPLVYDIVPRGLYTLLLDQGYRGKSYEKIDDILKKAALISLDMQSPKGEFPFGGRSFSFVHNEAWLVATFEYEAKRYYREGNLPMAARFKAAVERAIGVTEEWLSKSPLYHTKNRFPIETKFGCENYAYFDKYMITVASNLYSAYLICDDNIPYESSPDLEPTVRQIGDHFHKLFLKCGGYGVEFDLNADPSYDASGLGRVHKIGAPSAICLNCPCPKSPNFEVNLEQKYPIALSSAIKQGEVWSFGADEKYEVLSTLKTDTSVSAELKCNYKTGESVIETYTVSEDGVSIVAAYDGEFGYLLPAFCFDGEKYTEIICDKHSLSVVYDGYACTFTTNGIIIDLEKIAASRSGNHKVFAAVGSGEIHVKIEIHKR